MFTRDELIKGYVSLAGLDVRLDNKYRGIMFLVFERKQLVEDG